MNNNQTTKRMFNTRPKGKRTVRPKLRWGDSVNHNIRFLGERKCRNLALNREE
jgi:hypothetical protein